jgi:SNF2 family DNA or RNA helicase
MIELPECGPFIDMGLGKTVMTLTALDHLFKNKTIKKVLVIAPKKVAESVWSDEIEKWDHLNHLTFSKVLGTQKQRENGLVQKAQIYLINRENVVWLVSKYGLNWPFDTVVIDELSSFKNHKSQRFKALKMIRPYIKRAIGLTGTPASNGLLDLWSELFLLDKGKRLGTRFSEYRDMYFQPGSRDGHVVFNYTLKKGDPLLGEGYYRKEVFDRIKDICFSMKTEDYIDLPACIDNDIWLEMPDDLLKKYKDFERDQVLQFIETGKEISAVNAAGLTNKLLQFANGAIYDSEKTWHQVHDLKLDELEERFEMLNGKPLLTFYSFISDKERIQLRFKKAARELKTPQDIKDWNSGKIQMAICHPMSAGHGLNLQFGGWNMAWYGLPWSLELYKQAIKRIHRYGVENIVNNMRFLLKGSMDLDVSNALMGKDNLQNAVLKAVKARIHEYAGL